MKIGFFFYYMLFLVVEAHISVDSIYSVEQPEKEIFSYIQEPKADVEKINSNVLPFRGKLDLNSAVVPYQVLQLELEKIATESNLYSLHPSERNTTLEKLLNNPHVIQIMNKCNNFHSSPSCEEAYPYRTLDGTCNNLKELKWGSVFSPNVRIVPPVYEGAYELRKSVIGINLPSPRHITLQMLKDENNPTDDLSFLFTLFGQLIDHEITNTPIININGSRPVCCNNPESKSQVCTPILFSSNDPFYSPTNKTCVEFVRSAPYPSCNFGDRIPINAVTSFIDGSVIYGRNKEQSDNLRSLDGSGKLKSQGTMQGELLPHTINKHDEICPPNATNFCFAAGDDRVNENTFLTSLHTLFLREHNRLANSLLELNPSWNDEKLFQEARKIMGAELQNVVCNDFLPLLLGVDNMKAYGLCESEYNDLINPSVISEFSTAAFRLHSMISHQFNKDRPDEALMQMFSNPLPMYSDEMGHLLSNIINVPSQKNDHCVIPDVTNFLLKFPYEKIGIDLPTINIQRGRDHGLAPYVNVAEKCSDGKFKFLEFSDLVKLIPEENINLLQSLYQDVKDIDLWIGLLMENRVPGTVSGPTSNCIIASQFRQILTGDRFFYKNKNLPNSFTEAQIETLGASSLARIICENTNMSEIPTNPLLMPSIKNPLKFCQSFPALNLKLWKDHGKK